MVEVVAVAIVGHDDRNLLEHALAVPLSSGEASERPPRHLSRCGRSFYAGCGVPVHRLAVHRA
jgi:hypothetical protein